MPNRLRLKLLSACQSIIESFSGSIKKKLFLVMVLLTCLPLILLTVVAIHNAQNRLESEITSSNLSKIRWSGTFVDDQLHILDQVLFYLMNDKAVSKFMETAQRPDNPTDFTEQNMIFEKLSSQYLSNLNSFDEIMLFKEDAGKTYSILNGEERILTEQGAAAPWDSLEGRKVAYRFGADAGHFTMYRTIYRFIDRKLLGGIALQVNWSMFGPIFESLAGNDDGTIMVLDDTGRVVYRTAGKEASGDALGTAALRAIETRPDEHFYKTGPDYLFYQRFADGKMTLVKLIPTSIVSESSKGTIWFSIWIVTILVAVSVLFSIFVANKAASPILKLIRAIAWTEETTSDLAIGHNRKDEIGLLERKYAQIIRSRYQIHIEKRTAQLKALQAQINPHFLHNTLQSIGAMAVVKNVPDIYQIIQAISSNIRYAMQIGGDLVELRQELGHVRNYMLIQEFRYKDKIKVEWQLDRAVESCFIPPLSLQPIVENAFEHGFQNKSGVWTVRIATRRQPGKVVIEIADNGSGFSAEKELELRQRLSRHIEDIIINQESMALSNIQARFKAQFGSEYGLDIQSAPHEGTKVTLVLPYPFAQGGDADG